MVPMLIGGSLNVLGYGLAALGPGSWRGVDLRSRH